MPARLTAGPQGIGPARLGAPYSAFAGRYGSLPSPAAATSYDHFADWMRPSGLTAGNFSAIVECYGTPLDA